jgi:hypothetical protein
VVEVYSCPYTLNPILADCVVVEVYSYPYTLTPTLADCVPLTQPTQPLKEKCKREDISKVYDILSLFPLETNIPRYAVENLKVDSPICFNF